MKNKKADTTEILKWITMLGILAATIIAIVNGVDKIV